MTVRQDDFDNLISSGFHPPFSIQDGKCIMEIGCVYEVWFRGGASRTWAILNTDGFKTLKQLDLVTYLGYNLIVPYWSSKYRFRFLFDNAVISYGTTIRHPDQIRTYMIFFRKVI